MRGGPGVGGWLCHLLPQPVGVEVLNGACDVLGPSLCQGIWGIVIRAASSAGGGAVAWGSSSSGSSAAAMFCCAWEGPTSRGIRQDGG